MPHPLVIALIVYVVMSLLTAGAYGLDKRAAARQKQRTRERTLHLLALLGGWPGALLAQQLFQHKRAKTGFVLITYATAALHLAAWGLVLYLAMRGGGG